MERPKAEQTFIDRMTRVHLVKWAERQVRFGSPVVPEPYLEAFVDYAVDKGWLSKDGTKVLAKGFAVAASTLKGSGGGFNPAA